jgi:hypothetical protein
MFWVLGLWLPLLLLVFLLLNAKYREADDIGAFYLMVWPPLLIFCGFKASRVKHKLKAEIEDHIRKTYKPDFMEIVFWTNEPHGIAVNDDCIVAVTNQTVFEVPFEKVRKYSWEIQGYTQTRVYGGLDAGTFGAQTAAKFENAAARFRAQKNSGLFFTIADVDNPEIQIITANKKLLQRWFELINQTFEKREIQFQAAE